MTDKTAKTIILKYLVKFYGEEVAVEIFKNNQDNLFKKHGLAWSLGKDSLQFFCEYYLHDIYFSERCKPLAPVHYEMWDCFQDMIINKSHEKQCYLLPRGTAKTTITMGVAIWAAVYNYKSFILIASALQDTANSFIRNIRNAVEGNKRINESFGTIFDRRLCTVNTEQIEFKNKTMIQSISAASALRGKQYNNKRIELCILDDYQKDDEVQTEVQRDKKWKRFSDDVSYAMQADNSTILALGTLQCLNDFYDRVRKSPSFLTKHEKCIPMTQKELDTYFKSGLWEKFYKIFSDIKNDYRLDDAKEFYLQHESEMQFPLLWQDGWNCLDIAIRYFENPESFHQEMQGEIERTGIKLVKTVACLPEAEIEANDFKKVILSIDPATSEKKKADYSAFCVLAEAESGLYYARKSVIKQLEYDDYIAFILELLVKYEDITHISIEKNTYMGADLNKLIDEISKHPVLRSRNFTYFNESRTKNKDTRIKAIIPDINKARIIFNEEDNEAIEQIKDFAGCAYTVHDDMIDCLTDAIEHLPKVVSIPKLKILNLNKFGL